MTLQDVHKGCVQLLEFRHGNGTHIDGKFHIRCNGIDRAPSLDGAHVIRRLRCVGNAETIKLLNDGTCRRNRILLTKIGKAVAAGRHNMDGIAMGADGFIHKAFTVSINSNERADFLLPIFHQLMGTPKIAQAFLPYIETKDGRNAQLELMEHPDEKKKGCHIGTIIADGRGLHDMTVDFGHNLIHAFKNRIHMGCVENGFFLAFVQLIGIDYIAHCIEMGSFSPHVLQCLEDKGCFFRFVPRR